MVRTASTMLPLGTQLPAFELGVVSGVNLSPDDSLKGLSHISSFELTKRPLLMMVICAHCPFVKHVESGITNLFNSFGDDVQFLAISSNSVKTHPQDSPEFLANQANQLGWKFPYLFDSDQKLAKALKAACTPDFYIFWPSPDGVSTLRYRGQMDGSRPGNEIPVSGDDIRLALRSLLNGEDISANQKPSIGCNIKWHPGMEPEWFG
ncbi:thioredoxin family protein [Prochlorococcus marinus]|uniref:thioredoxin family protein n=1 Tax=Prochlorococcus marinus TaxID=1219 RepID=UPI0022B59BD5|nr:thioredoxin family protein [Prochlorococcus marinus]